MKQQDDKGGRQSRQKFGLFIGEILKLKASWYPQQAVSRREGRDNSRINFQIQVRNGVGSGMIEIGEQKIVYPEDNERGIEKPVPTKKESQSDKSILDISEAGRSKYNNQKNNYRQEPLRSDDSPRKPLHHCASVSAQTFQKDQNILKNVGSRASEKEIKIEQIESKQLQEANFKIDQLKTYIYTIRAGLFREKQRGENFFLKSSCQLFKQNMILHEMAKKIQNERRQGQDAIMKVEQLMEKLNIVNHNLLKIEGSYNRQILQEEAPVEGENEDRNDFGQEFVNSLEDMLQDQLTLMNRPSQQLAINRQLEKFEYIKQLSSQLEQARTLQRPDEEKISQMTKTINSLQQQLLYQRDNINTLDQQIQRTKEGLAESLKMLNRVDNDPNDKSQVNTRPPTGSLEDQWQQVLSKIEKITRTYVAIETNVLSICCIIKMKLERENNSKSEVQQLQKKLKLPKKIYQILLSNKTIRPRQL